jgi:hypothetical protein
MLRAKNGLRQAGEAGATINLQAETLIVEMGGRVSASLAELIRDLTVFVDVAHLTAAPVGVS